IYLAMEYIIPGDLEKNLASSWTENDTKLAVRQLLRGLEIMHSNNVTHRDLKPQIHPVHVKIGDFGISKRVPENSSTKLDTRFSIHGYTAPEVTLGETYTSAVDLWSLGCIIYRMI
ncbi:kinase-like protein, partial [Zopfia rhizophila CBS 207.26]